MVLQTAADMVKDGYINDAARNAYLAAFHAAQAYIVEHTGKIAKTHSGAQTQFAQLAMHEPRIADELRAFLPEGYELKDGCRLRGRRQCGDYIP